MGYSFSFLSADEADGLLVDFHELATISELLEGVQDDTEDDVQERHFDDHEER